MLISTRFDFEWSSVLVAKKQVGSPSRTNHCVGEVTYAWGVLGSVDDCAAAADGRSADS